MGGEQFAAAPFYFTGTFSMYASELATDVLGDNEKDITAPAAPDDASSSTIIDEAAFSSEKATPAPSVEPLALAG